MNEDQLRSLSLPDLYSLLSEATHKLLDAINEKANGVTLHERRQQVELIQELIREKKRAGEQ